MSGVPEVSSGGRGSPLCQAVILSVLRDSHVRELETYFLQDPGWAVHLTDRAEEALRLARALEPDLVVAELLVPGMDGLALCRGLRADPRTAKVPVVVVSVLGATDRALDAGADAFVRKPLPERDLIRVVRELTGERPPPSPLPASLRGLAALARELTSSHPAGKALARQVKGAAALLDADASVLLTSAEGAALRVKAAHGVSEEAAARFRAPLDESLTDTLGGLLGPGARERFLGVPVMRDDRVRGVLGVLRRESPPAGVGEERLLSIVADQVAAILELDHREHARIRAEREVESLAGVQERMDRALQIAGHDLRTPLNAIQGYIDLLTTGVFGPLTDRQADVVERVRAIGSHLHGVLEDIVAMVDPERQADLPPRPVNVAKVVRQAVSLVSPSAGKKGILLLTDVQEGLAVSCHQDRLRQVLVHVLDNAVKYGPAGSTVRIVEREAPEGGERWCVVKVSDDGPGIPADRLEEAFEPGKRLATSGDDPGGSGLGLAIARGLVSEMGGRITLGAGNPSGTTVRILLPISRTEGGEGERAADVRSSA